ncbi:MAG: Lin0512 family protein [Hyphomicrobiaceae bacterium]
MAEQRIILELGAGTALHGGDYTKAAVRAVNDAIHHSSLTFIRALGLKASDMRVEVTIGVQKPEAVDRAAVEAVLPHGRINVKVVKGGLDVPDPENNDLAVVASAAVEAWFDLAGATAS